MLEHLVSRRALGIELSGVRKVFELAKGMTDAVNLGLGQPHFPVADEIRASAAHAMEAGHNGYSVTQGIPELRLKIDHWLTETFGHDDREVIVTSGTSGGLVLALLATVDLGDEVIFCDPYFVAYPAMVRLAGGVPVAVDTYPDFRIDVDKIRAAITPRTKVILVNSPANPTGVVHPVETIKALAELAAERGILLLSDEIYRTFCYQREFISPARFYPGTVVVDGFGKSYGLTGWRLGFAHGPKAIIEQMAKLQQFTFVCAPTPFQHAAVTAWNLDHSHYTAEYRGKRDRLIAGIRSDYEFVVPEGAFYVFAKAPGGSATEFVKRAIEKNLLVIPGSTFSHRDTHFRVSYAASDDVLDRGIRILQDLARTK